jgi:hypothetical protein
VGNLRDLKAKAPRPKHSAFKAYEPGYIHTDVRYSETSEKWLPVFTPGFAQQKWLYLPQMADENRRRYLFVAIDRATRWVFVKVFLAKTAAVKPQVCFQQNARRLPHGTSNAPARSASGPCSRSEPSPPSVRGRWRAAWSNASMAGSKRCSKAITSGRARSWRRRSTATHSGIPSDRWQSCPHLYNQLLPQSALGSKPPLQAMKDWYTLKPELFKKQPYYLAGCDTYLLPVGKTSEAVLNLCLKTQLNISEH